MLLEKGLINTGPIRVDGENRRGSLRVLEREPSVSAANLQNTLVSKAHETLDQPRLEALPRICRQLGGGHRGILSQVLGDSGRDGPSGRPSREQAAAEERPFERPIAVHAAAAESSNLARRK
jgi:hypothetical protein